MKTTQLFIFSHLLYLDKHIVASLKHKSANKTIHKTYQNNSHLMNVFSFQVKNIFVCVMVLYVLWDNFMSTTIELCWYVSK